MRPFRTKHVLSGLVPRTSQCKITAKRWCESAALGKVSYSQPPRISVQASPSLTTALCFCPSESLFNNSFMFLSKQVPLQRQLCVSVLASPTSTTALCFCPSESSFNNSFVFLSQRVQLQQQLSVSVPASPSSTTALC